MSDRRRTSIRFVGVPTEDISSTIWVPDSNANNASNHASNSASNSASYGGSNGGNGKGEVWTKARIITQQDTILQVQYLATGKIATIDTGFEEIHKVNPHVVPDMTSLIHINEPGILYNLKERNHQRKPYTLMGTVMIAVNPLRRLPEPTFEEYHGTSSTKNDEPHPYGVAELSFQQMMFSNKSQSLVVSGESGAGKTETAKILLKYLVDRCLRSSNTPAQSGIDGLDDRILVSSPILEAFGNAKTGRNPNSSRFGKFMKLKFQSSSTSGLISHSSPKKGCVQRLVGAEIETYLLEKSRVVRVSEGERNYHIFYQLIQASLSPSMAHLNDVWSLCDMGPANSFRLLNQSSTVAVDGIDDVEQFGIVLSALKTIGIDDQQIRELLQTLSGLLHLGNISFNSVESGSGLTSEVSNPHQLQLAARCLGVTEEALRKVMTERNVWTRGELFVIALSAIDASYARDACIKTLYEKLFDYLVICVNDSLTTSESGVSTGSSAASVDSTSSGLFIGVLDIFGFENFAVNSFEQLLINFANESLQNSFNAQIFDDELKLYKAENIQCEISSKPENSGCIELLANRSTGILAILDGVSRQPKPSDERFCEEIHKKHAADRYFPAVHPKEKKSSFQIKHFAGRIKYTIGGDGQSLSSSTDWIDKNNDSSPDDLHALCEQHSSISLMRRLFSPSGPLPTPGSAKKAERRPSLLVKPTLSISFARSMTDLNSMLRSTSSLFIRCIKPNSSMLPDLFDNAYVVEQLRSLGILQTCEVLKVGLPTRLSYFELISSLSSIVDSIKHLTVGASETVLVACILSAYSIPEDIYRLGRTKVFFKAGQFSVLNAMLQSAASLPADALQEISKKISELLLASQTAHELVALLSEKLEDVTVQISSASQSVDYTLSTLQSRFPDEDVIKWNTIKRSIELIATAQPELAKERNSLQEQVAIIRANWSAVLASVKKSVASDGKCNEINLSLESCDTIFTATNNKLSEGEQVTTECLGAIRSVQALLNAKENAAQQRAVIDAATDLLEQAKSRAREAKDGELRCQLAYTEDRAEQCDDLLNQLLFRIEGLQFMQQDDLQQNFTGGKCSLERANGLLDTAQGLLDSCKTEICDLKGLLQRVTAGIAEFEAANASSEPAVSANSAAPTARRSSVKYSLKDLAAMRAAGGLPVKPAKPIKPATIESVSPAASESQPTSPVVVEPSKSAEVEATSDKPALPDGWKECLDKVSGRLYYVNKVTKERQWKHPGNGKSVPTKSAESSTNSRAVGAATSAPNGTNPSQAVLKKRTGPSRRPSMALTSDDQPSAGTKDMTADTVGDDDVKTVERYSSRLSVSMTDRKALDQMIQEAEAAAVAGAFNSSTTNESPLSREDIVAAARESKARAMAAMDRSSAAIFGEITITQMEYLGLEIKSGYLMKQSSILGIWKKRWFVLEGNTLSYYDRPQDAYGNSGKHFTLSPESLTSYTSTDNCFCVKASEDAHDSENWYLVSKDESEMESWMIAINSHIHMVYTDALYAATNGPRPDFWETGDVSTTFWKVPKPIGNVQRRPVGIRTHPSELAPRTGEGIFPGETVEVLQLLTADNNNFLRLAGDRGWIFENHPKGKYAIVQQIPGNFVPCRDRYRFPPTSGTPLPTYSGPCTETYKNAYSIAPGAYFDCVASWTETNETQEEDDSESLRHSRVFLKLGNGKGWVVMHSENGDCLVEKV